MKSGQRRGLRFRRKWNSASFRILLALCRSGTQAGWWVQLSRSWLDRLMLPGVGRKTMRPGPPNGRACVGVLEAGSGEAGNESRGRRAPGFPSQRCLCCRRGTVWKRRSGSLTPSESARKWCPKICPHVCLFFGEGYAPVHLWGASYPCGLSHSSRCPTQPPSPSPAAVWGPRMCSPPKDGGILVKRIRCVPAMVPHSGKNRGPPALCSGPWLPL